jgi:cyclopropane-fatty-acyl-phospholipid synthase
MAGSRLGFEQNVVQLHQMLGVKLAADGSAGMPLRPDWEPARPFLPSYPEAG